MSQSRSRRNLRVLCVAPVITLALIAGLLLWSLRAQSSSAESFERTYHDMQSAKDAQLYLREMQVDITSYWLSSDGKYLSKFQNANQNLGVKLARVSNMVLDQPSLEKLSIEMKIIETKWATSSRIQTVQGQPAQNFQLQLDLLDSQVSNIAAGLNAIMVWENRLLAARIARTHKDNLIVFVLVSLISIAAAASLCYWAW